MSDLTSKLRNLVRLDSWQNLFTSLGVKGRDSRVSSTFAARELLTDPECAALYEQNWHAGSAVDSVAGDAVKAWYKLAVEDDTDAADGEDLDAAIQKEYRRLQAKSKIKEALKWARTFGGALVFIGADDGLDLSQPLNLDGIKRVRYLHVFDRRYAVPTGSWESDIDSPIYGLPKLYTLLPLPGTGGTSRTVHHSRVLRFEGLTPTAERRVERQSWGLSTFERQYDPVRNLGTVLDATATACQSFSQGVLKVQDLANLLDSDQEQKVLARLTAFKLGLSMANVAMVDAQNETYERLGQPVTGLPDLLESFRMEASGAARVPKSKTYGAQAGELAGSEEDTKSWESIIQDVQESDVTPQLTRLTEILLAQKDGPLKGKKAPGWSLQANPLQPPDEGKMIERRERQMTVDKGYYEMNALESTEIRSSRFGGPAYSHETTLDPDITRQLEENERAERERDPDDDENLEGAAPGQGGQTGQQGGEGAAGARPGGRPAGRGGAAGGEPPAPGPRGAQPPTPGGAGRRPAT